MANYRKQIASATTELSAAPSAESGSTQPGPALGEALPAILSGSRAPVLDGLRGLAILLVMELHFSAPVWGQVTVRLDRIIGVGLNCGWVGVDLFFVLSGFLITGLLWDAKGKRHYFRNFYARRTLRIFPLYYAVLILFFLVIPRIASVGTAYQSLVAEQRWYWSYALNFHITALNDFPSYGVLGHFWSLAVEEQFYLIWPFVILVCNRRNLLRLCGLTLLVCLAIRVALVVSGYRLGAYVLMPARMDTLAVGGWLAILIRGPLPTDTQPWRLRALGVLGLSGAAFAALVVLGKGTALADQIMRTIGFTLLALFFGALLLLTILYREQSLFSRFWRYPALRLLGRYSYGLYIWHHIVAVYLPRLHLPLQALPTLAGSQILRLLAFSAIALGISILLALLSWHLLATPFLSLKRFSAPSGVRPVTQPRPAINQ